MEHEIQPDPQPKKWYRNELAIFITLSLIVASALVSVSMFIYVASGASLLDLSRPSYKSVRTEVKDEQFEGFSASGDVTKETLDKFNELYQRQITPVTGDDAFSGESLSDAALGIDDPNAIQ